MSIITLSEERVRNGTKGPGRGRPALASNDHTNPFVKPTPVQISGLRIYVKGASPGIVFEDAVFYTRRADGPYYRWSYETKLGQWSGSRMNASDLSPRELCLAKWTGVPQALRTSLGEHYVE